MHNNFTSLEQILETYLDKNKLMLSVLKENQHLNDKDFNILLGFLYGIEIYKLSTLGQDNKKLLNSLLPYCRNKYR